VKVLDSLGECIGHVYIDMKRSSATVDKDILDVGILRLQKEENQDRTGGGII